MSTAIQKHFPAALQRQLPVADPRLRVLATISGAREWAEFRNYDEQDFFWIIENGYVVAFNIAVETGPGRLRELRIFPDSLEYYGRTSGNSKAKKNPYAATWEQLLIQREDKPFLFSTRAQVLLNCSADLVTDLIDAGHFLEVQGTKYKRGRSGAACITRASFLSFLKSRREDPC